MLSAVRAVLIACVLLSVPLAAREVLKFSVPPGWALGFQAVTSDYRIREFVREGEIVEAWTELVTVQEFRRTGCEPRLRELFERYGQVREQRCPGATEKGAVEANERSVTYEWKTTAFCEGYAPHAELGRFVIGHDRWYRIAFTSKADLTDDARATWRAWLRSINVEDDD